MGHRHHGDVAGLYSLSTMSSTILSTMEDPFHEIGRHILAGAPDGCDAMGLADLLGARGQDAENGPAAHLHIARDDARSRLFAEAISFFLKDAEIIELPAWDCAPYDRVPPHVDIEARRLDALALLSTRGSGPRIVVTTVAAALQRLPARASFAGSLLELKKGETHDPADLVRFLDRHGYVGTGTVREPGEYTRRGGILDFFPPGVENPVRLDFFGDELEAIRTFDAISQRSTGTNDTVRLGPASEIPLDDQAIERFRTGYRTLFGAAQAGDLLYEAVSSGIRHPGMEHWLPLFHDRLETVFDYLPGSITLDADIDEAVAERLELIGEYYTARRRIADAGTSETGEMVYNPLPPGELYLTADDWDDALARRSVGIFSRFQAPDGAANTVSLGGRRAEDFSAARNRPDIDLLDAVGQRVSAEHAAGRRVVVAAYSRGSRDRLAGLLRDHGSGKATAVDDWSTAKALSPTQIAVVVLGLENGFTTPDIALYTEQDIFGDRLVRRRKDRRAEDFLSEISSLSAGDFVVHVDHGIGRYDRLETLEIGSAPHDCLRLIYAGDDRLFLPVENIDLLSRYGSDEVGAQLDKLGGAGWQARKAKAKERIREIAHRLLATAAKRALGRADIFAPQQDLYDEFVARFPYFATADQDRAIAETLDDLSSGRPMDRLICGDVGFGKTEVALRATFVTAMTGRQVAVVVPTTLLARQHHAVFVERFRGLPVNIAQLSRLVPPKQAAEAKAGLADGRVDIVIGTHALLAKSIAFKDLALLVVDEEQHFGVTQKERLKELKAGVHVLTLTATPIPRTLQLALAGVREMSLIASPPVDRLAVRTFIVPEDPVILREAIMRERGRAGQVFYVCPRVADLEGVAKRLAELVPEVKIAIAHGQLAAAALEDVMAAFYDGKFDLLLSTNIVESGLDIPTANTIVIHRADMFGLAQLYQLRGRVGRSKTRAYAYLTLPAGTPITANAQRRLDVMQTLDGLGAGFSLASHDMDIRGAGNLLGDEQSGHIKEVGVELYQQMLEEAVAAARQAGAQEAPAEPAPERTSWSPTISLGTPVLIPEHYVPDLDMRLGLYRRIAALVSPEEMEGLAAEMIDRFGSLQPEVENLLNVVTLKRLSLEAGVEKLDVGPKGAVVTFHDNNFANPAALVAFIARQADRLKLRPDHKLVISGEWPDEDARYDAAARLMRQLGTLANSGQAVT
ncbi:MAG: transcription-repair coupling factor [Alphaproteobacteria bacterium]|nr:transcription-repair coupling factor [Alphaproteobacteria bacterium]